MTATDRPTVSKEDVERLLKTERFRYQRINLPHGLHTQGHDRTPTVRCIFDDDLHGASVLDIGCCYGFFCYEAKRRHAGRVVGLEIDPERYRQAVILQRICNVDIELRQADFQDVVDQEHFDYVLLLNVIHHLPNPIGALNQIAGCVRKCFVLEFSTLTDRYARRRFGRSFSMMSHWLNRFPVLAISPLPEDPPKFVMSSSAVRRLLLEQRNLYRSVRILRSPFRTGREIAICEK